MDSLLCPIHRTEMYYSKSTDMYACQDADCVTARGVSKDVVMQLHAAQDSHFDPDWNPELNRTAPPSGRYSVDTQQQQRFPVRLHFGASSDLTAVANVDADNMRHALSQVAELIDKKEVVLYTAPSGAKTVINYGMVTMAMPHDE